MKLRIFLPAAERPDAATQFRWMLRDGRGDLLREGESPLSDIPRANEVEAVLPSQRVLFARLKLPRVSDKTIRELLPYAVEDRLLADPAHIHAVAGRTLASGETLVAVVDREWLAAMLDALARSGLRPAHAWPESALLAGGHDDWNLVWGPRRGILVDDDGVSATFDHDASGTLPLALRLALDEAAARGEKPASIRVHTEGGSTLPDLARWSSEAGAAFSRGSRWEELSRDEPHPGCIDLLQGEFSLRRTPALRLPRAAVALAAIIGVAQIGFVALDAWRLERERARLEAQREALFRASFPEAKVVVDPDLQMKRDLAELKRTRGIAGADEFLSALARAAHETPAPVKSVEYANGKLTIRRGDGAQRVVEGRADSPMVGVP
jgi:general secretion pathway protein L